VLGTILLVILILLLIGALPRWGYSSGWGYYPSAGIGLVLIIIIILLLPLPRPVFMKNATRSTTDTRPVSVPAKLRLPSGDKRHLGQPGSAPASSVLAR